MEKPAPLTGRRIAVLETREADRLAAMLRREGAEVIGCPTIRIVEPADPTPVQAWLDRFIAKPCDDLILTTGEGLTRLFAAAEAGGRAAAFLDALRRTQTLIRGPKPARALRALGLEPGLRAAEPTTEGIIAALAGRPLRRRRIGVQLYPGAPDRLPLFLTEAGAEIDPVTPYDYASYGPDEAIAAMIERIAGGGVDAVAFTSAAQIRRLFEVARARGWEERLRAALTRTAVAAIGPIVKAELQQCGVPVAVMPQDSYFMKPLVTALVTALSSDT